MHEAVLSIVKNVGWKLVTLFRVRRQYSIPSFITLYKTQIWSSLEGATPAIAHATFTLLDNIDRVQRKFLRFIGMPWDVAFVEYKLAPLALRRRIALMGLIHRCATGQAPRKLCAMFPLDGRSNVNRTRRANRYHNLRLVDRIDGTQCTITQRSIYGLIKFYNILPQNVVKNKNPRHLQGYLQHEAMKRCKSGMSIDEVSSLQWL